MSTLSSSSTIAEVKDAYDDNASYYEDNSVAKAKGLVTAGLILLRRVPKRARHGSPGEEIEIDPAVIAAEVRTAKAFIEASGGGTGGPRVKHPSFEDYRS